MGIPYPFYKKIFKNILVKLLILEMEDKIDEPILEIKKELPTEEKEKIVEIIKKPEEHAQQIKTKSNIDIQLPASKWFYVASLLLVILSLSVITSGFGGIFSITGSAVTGETLPLELFVMSQCPYGVQAENSILEMMKTVKGVDLQVHYIMNDDGDGTFSSLHGQAEVDENLRQVCIMKKYPAKFLSYLSCINANYQNAGTTWESCAQNNGMDVNAIKNCWNSAESVQLARENLKRTSEIGATGSPTIYINRKLYTGGRAPSDFQAGVCNVKTLAGCGAQVSSAAGALQGNC